MIICYDRNSAALAARRAPRNAPCIHHPNDSTAPLQYDHLHASGSMIRFLASALLAGAALCNMNALAQDAAGLRMGMTRAEVESATGPLEPDDTSFLRNAFTAQRLPGETANPLFSFAERSVYFADEGRLWRVHIRIHDADGALFPPDAAMAFYHSLSARLEKAHQLVNSREPQPLPKPGGDCEAPPAAAKPEGTKSEAAKRSEPAAKKNAKGKTKATSAATTKKAAAPAKIAAPAVIRQIACGVLTAWSRTFVASGEVAHDVALRDGTLTASPVIYHLYRIEGGNPQNLSMYQRLRRKQD